MSGRRVVVLIALVITGALTAVGVGSATSATVPTGYAGRAFTNVGVGTYVVPAGITMVHVEAIGGHGGKGGSVNGAQGLGGVGAKVGADIPVKAGTEFYATVAANGQDASSAAPSSAFGGGGAGGKSTGRDGGGGGGGASRLVECTPGSTCAISQATTLLLIAGGGGGGGECRAGSAGCAGGDAGPGIGTGGQTVEGSGGQGSVAVQSAGAGGAAGQAGAGFTAAGSAGGDGSFGQGGVGANGPGGDADHSGGAGGGGGGGWYGGGGGGSGAASVGFRSFGNGGGGGGGASYIATGASGPLADAPASAPPSVTITPWMPTSISVACGQASIAVGSRMACTATVTTIGGAAVDGATVAMTALSQGQFPKPTCTLRRGRCSATLSMPSNSLLGPAGVTATVSKALPYLPSSASTRFEVVPRTADLQVAQLGTPEPGGKARFTITVRNLGPVAAHGVHVSEVLSAASALKVKLIHPGGFACRQAALPSGKELAVRCRLDRLAANAHAAITVTVAGKRHTAIAADARVRLKAPVDPDLGNNRAATNTWTGPVAGLVVSEQGTTGLNPGDASFAITTTNEGPDPAHGLTLRVQLSSTHQRVQLGTIKTGGGTCTVSQPAPTPLTMTEMDVVCRLPAKQRLAVGHSWVVHVPVSGPDGDLVIANATVSAPKLFIPQKTNVTAAYTYFGPVQQTADLQVKVSAGWLAMKKKGNGGHPGSIPVLGYKFAMTVIVTNLGPGTATGIVLTVDAGRFGHGCGCTKNSLGPGRSWTTTHGSDGKVDNPGSTSVSASVHAAASVYDPNPDNNSDVASPAPPGQGHNG